MADRIRFYTDEHVSAAVVSGLRRRGADVLATPEAGMLGASDEAHLVFARQEGRILFTQDDDFLALAAAGVAHAGVVYARQGTSTGRVLAGLLLIYDVLDAREMADHIEFI